MTFIVKNWKRVLIVMIVAVSFFVLVQWSLFLNILGSPANTVFENLAIEFTAGLIFVLVPLLFGVSLGKRVKELEFYNGIEKVFETLIQLRRNGLVDPDTVRHLVQSITKHFGSEAVKQQWLERAAMRLTQLQIDNTKSCRICSLDAEVRNNKCRFCELNCYAWDFSSRAERAKEEFEIKRIAEIVESKRTK